MKAKGSGFPEPFVEKSCLGSSPGKLANQDRFG
jgi:hypothetical protein